MQPIDKFTLQVHEGPYDKRPLTSQLYYQGKATITRVPGYCIEKQFACQDYFLLLINWDCPFEESYEIVVLNADFQLIEKRSIGTPYTSYNLSDVCLVSKNSYRLVFNSDAVFKLQINYPKQHIFQSVIKLDSSKL
jgi:hypothetical protein